MRDKLRKCYQVQKEVTQNGSFEGEIALPELKRLGELLRLEAPDLKGRNIAVSFEFVRNEFDIPMIVGHLQASLELECQRCLKPIQTPMELDFSLDDGYIDITEVIEDELILAVPLVAMHEDTACNNNGPLRGPHTGQLTDTQAEAAVKENPFAVLQQLKTTD
jgi:uncharacterized protein